MKIYKYIVASFFIIGIISIILTLNNPKTFLKIGKSNAPISIIEYSNFQCRDCRDTHSKIGEKINNYIESGIVKYEIRFVDIERFEYDDLIYEHLNNKDFKSLEKINDIFEKQDEWIYYESKEQVIKELNLNHNKQRDKKYMENKKTMKEKGIVEVPTFYVKHNKEEQLIDKNNLIDEIEKIIRIYNLG